MEQRLKVGISGLGLIGSSILKGLAKNSCYELYCHSISSAKKALEYTKNASSDIKILKDCDIVFVCCELLKTVHVLDELNIFLNKKTIVADVSSVKSILLNKKYNFDFILSHPMAGSEKQGFDAGDEDLFIGAKWLVLKKNNILEKIIKDLGAISFEIDMNKHDFMCAQISHLPTILSFLLFDSALDDSKLIASSGFRDTTRLAMTNASLAYGMLKNNEENIIKAFDILLDKFNSLKNISDNEKIKLFEEISKKRMKMYNKDGKNVFKI